MIYVLGWCCFWWIWGICEVFCRLPWDEVMNDPDIQKRSAYFPPVVAAIIWTLVAFSYVLFVPFLKPKWWVQKEISKWKMRQYVKRIKATLATAGVQDGPIIDNLDELLVVASRQKDKSW